MTTELEASVSNATTKSIKDQNLAKQRDWTSGKKRTEKRLPSYSIKGFYIPKFDEMDYDTVMFIKKYSKLQGIKP